MLAEKVRRTIEEHKLLNKNEHIVLGLSGGPDSVCLFHILLRLKDEYNLTIYPVHINHKFRPGAAERDQQYVEQLCSEKGIQCSTFEIDCNELAGRLGMTSEEAGRKARYDSFYQVAEHIAESIASDSAKLDVNHRDESEYGLAEARAQVKIAVAQNANDQAETILFRLLRGTGTDGLAGIAYEREERGFSVIRPLLDIYRDEIEEYCDSNKLNPVIDHTNNEEIYARNKIRLELLPHLEKRYNENMKESLVRLGRIAAADKDYIWQQVEKEYKRLANRQYAIRSDKSSKSELQNDSRAETEAAGHDRPLSVTMDRQELSCLHPAVRHRIILKAFGEIGLEKDISEERIKAADFIIEKKQAPKTVQFPRGYRLTVAKGRVIFHNGESFVK